MPVSAGDTFLYPLNESTKEHLWVVATDPHDDGRVAIVSLTSLRGAKDQTVILRKGDHPFIKWETCVYYAFADVWSTEKIAAEVAASNPVHLESLRPDILQLIVDGFTSSDFVKNRVLIYVSERKRNRKASANPPGTSSADDLEGSAQTGSRR